MSAFGPAAIWRRWRNPEPPKPPAWEGNCACCGRRLKSDMPYEPTDVVECMACICGLSPKGKEREAKKRQEAEDRQQIELIKRAIRELEEERK